MSTYAYEAVDGDGLKIRGAVEVSNQNEALQRIREMGLFPTRVRERPAKPGPARPCRAAKARGFRNLTIRIPGFSDRVKPKVLAVFTRQLATLVEAGMPLLRSLRILQQQETNRVLKEVIARLEVSIEGGGAFSEAVAVHPKLFDRLYVNMVKAGELSGSLDISLQRLAEFMEKAERIKGKVKAALFYPAAVVTVATVIMGVMMVYVVPKFKAVFDGLMNGRPMPAFTVFVFRISEVIQHNFLFVAGAGAVLAVAFGACLRTKWGRYAFDQFKLAAPVFGPVFRKAAISRFARTLGTLVRNGVPILQALNIVRETAGNMVVAGVVANIHESVKQGETIAQPLKTSSVFPPIIAGMVDVGEQTGALPEMLLKVADNCDEEVDNAVSAMTSLLEPILIVFLGVVVGAIVIALFLPIITVASDGFGGANGRGGTD